jgi:hypothetical protein
MKEYFPPLMLLAYGGFLRIYRISQLTEFRGDQGSTGSMIFDAWKSGSLLLHGPAASTGHFFGPFYYWLLTPVFVISGFRPEAVAVFFAFLGIAAIGMLYLYSRRTFGFWPAIILGGLYATAPQMVASDRMIWNPTAIPLLVLILVIAMHRVESGKYGSVFLLGAIPGFLIQLHYSNMYTVLMTGVFWIWHVYRFGKKRDSTRYLRLTVIAAVTFITVLFPYLVYESRKNYSDLSGLLGFIVQADSGGIGKRQFLWNFYDYATRIMGFYTSGIRREILMISFVAISALTFFSRSIFFRFITVWIWVGVALVSKSNVTVFNHYLYFLVPMPLFLIGHILSGSANKRALKAGLVIFGFVIAANIHATDLQATGDNDIRRTRLLTNRMIAQSNGEPFSFTVLRSKSFSDYHYRYFLTTLGVSPQTITDHYYKKLFLVCEEPPCPTDKEISTMAEVRVMCFDHQCNRIYPTVSLREWKYIWRENTDRAVLYTFSKQ